MIRRILFIFRFSQRHVIIKPIKIDATVSVIREFVWGEAREKGK